MKPAIDYIQYCDERHEHCQNNQKLMATAHRSARINSVKLLVMLGRSLRAGTLLRLGCIVYISITL